ncbi:uncharacterized protein LOC141902235 [Tubulanus polymorphus]|uniref:uncharacterized protein LOC141902235 n=1 Tax=Tubulanus polymorphus TaxID=672921 RepID=UPI003DA6C137
MTINKRSRVIGISVVLISVIFYLADHTVIGQQKNCINAADTTIKTVTPANVKVGGIAVVQCQVSPPSKDFCGHRIDMYRPYPGRFAFDKTNCPRGTPASRCMMLEDGHVTI